jgi:chemotaxis protein MotB
MEDENKANPNEWVLAYGDLVTLLMTFFVLIISLSEMDTEDLAEVLNFNKGIGRNFVSAELKDTGLFDEKVVNKAKLELEDDELPSPLNDLDSISEELVVFITKNDLAKAIDLERTEKGFMIIIKADILFESGEAELMDKCLYLLYELAELLSKTTLDVKITGHTDDRYSDNDNVGNKLSIARAARVCSYFIEEGMLEPVRFGVSGYGSRRPRLPNISEHNRAKNRRVEIIIEEIEGM